MTHNTMDDVIEEWKDVLPGDVTSEQAWDPGWKLIHANVAKVHDRTSLEILKDYVKKRFGRKDKFVAFINERTGIELSDKKSYNLLFSEIYENVGENNFLSILGIKDVKRS